MKKIDYRQIGFRVDTELIKDLKQRALDLGIPLRTWLLQAITEKIVREEKHK
jgi:predicted DNA binding CopG/RHH family protein